MLKIHGLQIYIQSTEIRCTYLIPNTSSVHVSQFYTALCLLAIPFLLKFSKPKVSIYASFSCIQKTIFGYNGLHPNKKRQRY